ncbi:MAG TPA: YciI family protein [Cyclobacteriaceae bacterium]
MKRVLILPFFLVCFFLNAQSLTFVFLNKKADAAQLPKEQNDKIMEGHMANINRLAKEGKLIAAGPFDGGGGIFIFKSNSIEDVKNWLSTDPGVQANRWNTEILPYQPRYGSACTVSEPYEWFLITLYVM